MAPRYALYCAPRPDEDLAKFANHWLGRDAETNRDLPQSAFDGVSAAEIAAATAEPRRYGFHGTLKPPFAPAAGATADAILDFAAEFVARQVPFTLSRLRLTSLRRFIALVPEEPSTALDRLATDCLLEFDRFRAPPSEAELARRRQAELTARQDALLQRWGYPYVLDEFRFHLTLTGTVADETRRRIHRLLTPLTEPLLASGFQVRDLVVFVEDERGSPFRVLARLPFTRAL